jgi:hypothetical protein
VGSARLVASDRASQQGEGRPRPLRFPSLTFLDEGEDVVVGRPDTDSYVVLPADGAALLRRLYDGADRTEAADWYAREFGESVDIDDFLDALRGMDLVSDAPDAGETATDAPAEISGRATAVRYKRLGAAVFSGPAWVVYLAVLIAGVAVVVADPSLAPRHERVFFSDSLVVVELSLLVLTFPLVAVHELAHVLAGRRLGLRTRLRVSRRLYFVVFETVMNGLVAVPRAQRYLPMLAGLLADLVLAAAFTVTAWLVRGPIAAIGWLAGLCLALALTTLLRAAWQLYFFLRTDLYYLVTTVLGCVDLHTVAREYLRNAVNRRLGRSHRLVAEDSWHPRDRRAVRWYAPLVVVGYTVAIGLLVVVMLPVAWTFLSQAFGRVFLGQSSSTGQLWDSAVLLLLNAAQLGAAGVLAVRDRRRTLWQARHRAPRVRRPRAGRRFRPAPHAPSTAAWSAAAHPLESS